jgi:hypothetical protein
MLHRNICALSAQCGSNIRRINLAHGIAAPASAAQNSRLDQENQSGKNQDNTQEKREISGIFRYPALKPLLLTP